METVIVTGGTGFVGKHLIPKLINDYDTYVIVRSYNKAKELFSRDVLNHITLLKGDLSRHDINLEKSIKNIYVDKLYIINLAGKVNLTSNSKFFNDIYKHNVETLSNLLKLLEQTGKIEHISLFLHLSSLAAMGALNPSTVFTQDSPCLPVIPYEVSKFKS